ncbi:hypothetical protein K438DRAFT_1772196 [Mycena galopus ATCC 62051]|nr:hypothetical protein K438DRAFT_1772196 [Mycena galopus ATCC 62051]
MADHQNTKVPLSFLPPIFLTRRRVIIACTNCRKRKIRHPCNRCATKGLKCQYITIANQRDEASTNKSAPLEPRRQGSSSPLAGSARAKRQESSRPIDPHWGENSRNAPNAPWTTLPLPHEPVPISRHRYQPYRTRSAGCMSEDYNRAYEMPNVPLTMQPDPYLDLARDFIPRRRRTDDSFPMPTRNAEGSHTSPQWLRCTGIANSSQLFGHVSRHPKEKFKAVVKRGNDFATTARTHAKFQDGKFFICGRPFESNQCNQGSPSQKFVTIGLQRRSPTDRLNIINAQRLDAGVMCIHKHPIYPLAVLGLGIRHTPRPPDQSEL